MKKKSLVTMIATLGLIAVVGIGSTLAYFTDKTDTKTNVVTMGQVDIDLSETTDDTDNTTITDTGIEYDNVKPGDTLSKKPVVTVAADSEDAYIRVKINASSENTFLTEDVILACLDINTTNWVKSGDYYYYQTITKASDELKVFENVKIPEAWDNTVANASFNITIQAEAIQSDNVTPITNADGQIIGWPEAEIKALS